MTAEDFTNLHLQYLSTQAEGEQAHGERVVGNIVHIVCPQREDAIATPAPPCGACRGKVAVVQARAQGQFRRIADQGGSGVGAGDG